MNRATVLTRNACIIHEQSNAFEIASMAHSVMTYCYSLLSSIPHSFSVTANGNIKYRKIDEDNRHFSLDADFVLIIPRSPLYYNTHTHQSMVHMGLVKFLNFPQ